MGMHRGDTENEATSEYDFEMDFEDSLLPSLKKTSPKEQKAVRVLRTIFASPGPIDARLDTVWIDGLRGIACILVVFSHWSGYAGIEQDPVFGATSTYTGTVYRQWYRLPIFRWVFCSADSAVSLFFIISGYVLSKKSLKHISDKEYEKFVMTLSSTALRRIPRLWIPASLCSLTGMIIIKQGFRRQFLYIVPESSSSIQELWNWFIECAKLSNPLAFHDVLTSSLYEFTLWTIPIEYLGSIAVFVSLLIMCRARKPYRQLFYIVAGLQVMLLRKTCHLSMFFAGMFFAELDSDIGAQSTTTGLINHVLLLLCVWLCQIPKEMSVFSGYTTPGWTFLYHIVPTSMAERFWNSVATVMLFFIAPRISWLKKALETRLCQFLGRISFSLYLIHFQFNDVFGRPHFSPWLIRVAEQHGFLVNFALFFLWWGTMLPLVFLLASWHQRWVDRGAVKFARWLESVITS